MVKTHFLFIFLLFSLTTLSQEDICIGKQYIISSTILQENRSFRIYLPENYPDTNSQTYPVIYLLDGDSFFNSLVGICKALDSGKRKLPPFIIVGISNTDRIRDFTPTASAAGRDGKIMADSIPKGGGSKAFTRFLTEELRSVIDSSYRTNGQNMLIGHSYAGLFTLNTFLLYMELFDYYLAIDPSMWWDIHLNKVSHLISEVFPNAEGLRFFSKSFPEESHGTIPVPGIYDGIKQLLYNK